MKKILTLMALAVMAMSLAAAPVDQAAAYRLAKNYLSQYYAGKVMAPAALNPVLLKAEIGDVKTNKPVYYIYNTSTTFLVVSGDDRAEEVLMVGDAPLKDINNLPLGMRDMLNIYKEQIMYLHEHPGVVVHKISENSKGNRLNAVTYGPLLTAKWDQAEPYWNQCKFTYNNRTYQCYTGCPATSASMVLYYWKYPASVDALPSYTASLELSSYQSVNYTYPALPATTFEWGNMKDTYGSYTTAQGNAVATLMRYVGQAEGMMYGTASAGGSGIYASENYRIADMFKLFGYKSTAQNAQRSSYSTSAKWNSLIQSELALGRPLVYCAVSSTEGGHAFNVDGWRDSDSKYHVNWGWSGDGNSWFAMDAFSDGSGTFNQQQQAIIGVEPPDGAVVTPVLNVNPTSLSFEGETGTTYTKTFTVSSEDVVGDVTIASNNNYFTVSPTTLTVAQAKAGATITVTYKPVVAGTTSGQISVSSNGAETKTVTVTGTATAPVATPKLTINPTSLSFSTSVGTPVVQTFKVTGTNLTSNITLAVSGAGFTIDKTTIKKSLAPAGATVTVTYTPTASGTHTGTVTLTTAGLTSTDEYVTATVNLNGTATGAPTIVANPTSLSFNTTPGAPVTKTFTVTGTDLTGNVALAVSGTGFSIDKTSISRNAATSGSTVTVTYNPTTGGAHTGTVTLTSSGAQTVTVALNGTSTTTPTITANPTALSFSTTVGTPVTKTFTVNGAYLEGNVTLAVAGDGFSIDKTSISQSAAGSGSTVTVTYNPTVFGDHTGTVTLNSTGASPVTVTLAGTAGLLKFAPVMQPAIEDYINLTQFRADWTDQTVADNVESYTLEVSAKPVEPVEPDPELIGSIDGTTYTNQNYQAVTLSSPWSGNNVYGGYGAIYFRNATHQSATTDGYIKYTIPAGYENRTFTVKITTASSEYGSGRFVVGSNQTTAVQYNMTTSETHSWLVTGSTGEVITITSPEDQYSPDIALIEVYSGNAAEVRLMANETGDATYRLITGITDKFYTVNNLTAEGTFLYKVKAIYIDGTESEWSNIEEVTLFQNGHGFEPGDVDHDGAVAIKDVSVLIDALLGNSATDYCEICADVNGDGEVSIKDVSDLIDILLGNRTTNSMLLKKYKMNPDK